MPSHDLKLGQYIRVTGKVIATRNGGITVQFPKESGGAIYMSNESLEASDTEIVSRVDFTAEQINAIESFLQQKHVSYLLKWLRDHTGT